MGQQSVIDALKAIDGEATTGEISEMTGTSRATICRSIKKLRNQRIVRQTRRGVHLLYTLENR